MDTHSTITPSAHLPTVEALLQKLDEMKDGNVGAKQRLELLMQKGPEVVPDFDYGDAFDLSRRAQTHRLEKINELRASVDAMTARWHEAPLDEDVEKAGSRLIGHLREFVHQAQRKEAEHEVEVLASLWPSSPDVSEQFGLPTPPYYPRRAKTEEGSDPDQKKKALEAVHDELAAEIAEENLEVHTEEIAEELHKAFVDGVGKSIDITELEHEKEALERQDVSVPILVAQGNPGDEGKVVTTVSGQEPASDPKANPEKQKEISELIKDPEVRAHLAGRRTDKGAQAIKKAMDSWDGEVQGKLTHQKHGVPRLPQTPEVLEEEMDMLDIRSWTLALNEVTASNWRFDRQLRGRIGDKARMGVTLVWTKGKEEVRLDVERLADDEVLVRLVPPRSTKAWSFEDKEKMYRVHAEEMKQDVLEELHKDPSEFVKLILR